MGNNLKLKAILPMCLVVLLAGLAVAVAQTAPTPATPTVDQILDKYVKAIGGKAANEKLTSRVSKGTFEMEQMPGPAAEEIGEKAPNKTYMITDSPGFGTFKRGFNGTAGWEDNPQNGQRDITGAELAAMKRDSEFYHAIKLKELYPKMTLKGKESVNGHDAYAIEMTPPEGSPTTMYFGVDSGLLVRTVSQSEGPMGPVTIDATFDDYRETDGVRIAYVLHISMGDFAFTIKLTEVKHNVPIDDAKFDKPPAQ